MFPQEVNQSLRLILTENELMKVLNVWMTPDLALRERMLKQGSSWDETYPFLDEQWHDLQAHSSDKPLGKYLPAWRSLPIITAKDLENSPH